MPQPSISARVGWWWMKSTDILKVTWRYVYIDSLGLNNMDGILQNGGHFGIDDGIRNLLHYR